MFLHDLPLLVAIYHYAINSKSKTMIKLAPNDFKVNKFGKEKFPYSFLLLNYCYLILMLIKLIARTPLQKNYIFSFILIYFFL